MKALALTLCMLLVVPAGAQQMAAPRTPNFYVPYGVRDIPVEVTALESSSDEMSVADPPQRSTAPMPRRYPMPPRGRHRRQRRNYGAIPLASPAMTGAEIGALFAIGLAFVAIFAGDQ